MAAPKRSKDAPKRQPTGDYKHGFAKIDPKHQWKKGQSGNPRGGKKKPPPDFGEIFLREANRLALVDNGTTVEKIPKIEVLVRKLLDKAINGNMPAARLVLPFYERFLAMKRDGVNELGFVQPLSPEEMDAIRIAASIAEQNRPKEA